MILKYLFLLILTMFIVGCGNKKTNADVGETNSSNSLEIKTVNSFDKYIPHEKVFKINIGDDVVNIIVNEKESVLPLILFNLHENEVTSYNAGKSIFDKYGGKLVKLSLRGERNISFRLNGSNYTFDPNRIFSEAGRKNTLNNLGNSSLAAESTLGIFATALLDSFSISKGKIVITLHNNTSGNYSINSYMNNGAESVNALDINYNKRISEDNFFLVTSKTVFNALKSQDMNVVLQNNSVAIDDGSLSTYCAEKNIEYINVEAQSDNLNYQIKMLEILISELNKLYIENLDSESMPIEEYERGENVSVPGPIEDPSPFPGKK